MNQTSCNKPRPIERRKRWIRRIGWGIVGAGLTLAFIVALIGGAATRNSDRAGIEAALIMRNVAAGIILTGLVAVLIAQRLEAMQRWYRLRIDVRSTTPEAARNTTVGLSVGATSLLLLLWWISGIAVSPALQGCMVVMAGFAVPPLTALLVLHLRGVPRFFFIGVLVTAIFNLVVTIVAVTSMPANISSAGALRDLGRYMFPLVTLVWLVALLMGLVFAAVAFAIGNQGQPSDDQR